MFSRTHVSIPKTTWAYAAILGVAVVGAVMREINLLIILAGMMCGPLLISWQMVHTNLRNLQVRRRLPQGVFAGVPFDVEFAVTNGRRTIDSWALVLDDRIRNLTQPESKDRLAHCFVPHVSAKQTATARYPARLFARGRYRLGPLRVSTRVPVGLLRGRIESKKHDEILVYPKLGFLRSGWSTAVQYDQQGQRNAQRRQGRMEGNFFGLRDWQSGDSRRWIHWRSTAKRNELVVRQFEQHRCHDLVMLVDLSWPSDADVDEAAREKLELAISFVASAVSDYCRRAAGKLTLRIVGQPSAEVRGPCGPGILTDILDLLAEVTFGDDATPSESFGPLPRLSVDDRLVIVGIRPVDLDRWCQADAETGGIDRSRLNAATQFDVSHEQFANVFSLSKEPQPAAHEESIT